jgi:hypothetical protein
MYQYNTGIYTVCVGFSFFKHPVCIEKCYNVSTSNSHKFGGSSVINPGAVLLNYLLTLKVVLYEELANAREPDAFEIVHGKMWEIR